MENETKMYELTYLVTPLVPEDKLSDENNAIRALIEKKQGIIMYEEGLKSLSLSYPIKKFDRAYLGLFKFVMPSEEADGLKDVLEKQEKIIRAAINQTRASSQKDETRPRKIRTLKVKKEEKQEIKTEEIDKKLEEMLGQ